MSKQTPTVISTAQSGGTAFFSRTLPTQTHWRRHTRSSQIAASSQVERGVRCVLLRPDCVVRPVLDAWLALHGVVQRRVLHKPCAQRRHSERAKPERAQQDRLPLTLLGLGAVDPRDVKAVERVIPRAGCGEQNRADGVGVARQACADTAAALCCQEKRRERAGGKTVSTMASRGRQQDMSACCGCSAHRGTDPRRHTDAPAPPSAAQT